jgi:ABC-type dipeptide/oligopeptide/nickel transport system permease component
LILSCARGASQGLGSAAIFWRHVLPVVSFAIAFGAAIPIEALCDSPGLGQLAWQAALSRDLPLIVNVTLVVCFSDARSELAC